MPVSHLTNSVAEMLAAALNTVTEGSYSHLTTSEAEMLALLVSEMTGQSYSHLTTSVETLWELLLTQSASDGITFDREDDSNEEIMAIIANNVSAGGGEEWPPEGAVAAFDFKNGRYYFGGASHTLAESFEHDQENAGAYSASDVVEGVGLRVESANQAGSNPMFTAAADDDCFNSTAVATLQITGGDIGGAGSLFFETADFPDYTREWKMSCDRGVTYVEDTGDSVFVQVGGHQEGLNRVAFTFAGAGLAVSLNGSAVETTGAVSANTTATNIFLQLSSQVASNNVIVLEQIVFYAPRPTGDLPALSAIA